MPCSLATAVVMSKARQTPGDGGTDLRWSLPTPAARFNDLDLQNPGHRGRSHAAEGRPAKAECDLGKSPLIPNSLTATIEAAAGWLGRLEAFARASGQKNGLGRTGF